MTIVYVISPPVDNDTLNALFAAAWEQHTFSDFARVHQHSLAYIGAYEDERLVGYVNLAWDGGVHAFLLDTTVHPDRQRRGIGAELVKQAAEVAKSHGLEWLHVDFEPHLAKFYYGAGFVPTDAGLLKLR